MTSPKDMTQGVALGVITGALWGLVFLAPKVASDFSPMMLVSGRYIAYGAMAFGLMMLRREQIVPLLTGRNLLVAFGLSLVANTIYYLLLANAIILAGVPIATLIIGFIPVTVALSGAMRKGALPIKRFWPALVLGSAATLLITFDAVQDGAMMGSSAPVVGLIFALAALVSWTIFAVGNSRFLQSQSAISAQDWNLILGVVTGFQGLLVLPLALSQPGLPTEAEPWMIFLAVSLVIALLSSLIANAMWNKVSQLLPLTLIGPLVLFETLFALIYGFIWEQRFPDMVEVLAIVLMVSSVFLSVRAHGPSEAGRLA